MEVSVWFRGWIRAATASRATAIIPDLSRIFNLCLSLWQQWILNPLSEARDRTHILMDTSPVLDLLSHNRNSYTLCIFYLNFLKKEFFFFQLTPNSQFLPPWGQYHTCWECRVAPQGAYRGHTCLDVVGDKVGGDRTWVFLPSDCGRMAPAQPCRVEVPMESCSW